VNFRESPVTFSCDDAELVGVVATPDIPAPRGVLIAVGGPQYRAGSHRQLVLLSRHLASSGIPAFRFDFRGMGDSGGETRTFQFVDDDLASAIDAFFDRVNGLQEIVIWGLCGAASAALLYAHRHSRVCGLVLANPWVRTEQGMARTMVKRYYASRVFEARTWRRLLSGDINFTQSLRDIYGSVAALIPAHSARTTASTEVFPQRMAEGLRLFRGRVLICLSGNDFTAQEFEEMCRSSAAWKNALKHPHLEWRRLPEANHTFSTRKWRDQVNRWTSDWVMSW